MHLTIQITLSMKDATVGLPSARAELRVCMHHCLEKGMQVCRRWCGHHHVHPVGELHPSNESASPGEASVFAQVMIVTTSWQQRGE